MKRLEIIKNGFFTGLLLQIAIGPVFFFITNLAIQKSIWDGMSGVVAATAVDYFYITLSLLGLGKVLKKERVKRVFGTLSSLVLIIFGIIIIHSSSNFTGVKASVSGRPELINSLLSTLILTISSPMTIIFWTSIFSAKAIEYNYTKNESFIFGFSTGLATPIFMGFAVILSVILGHNIPTIVVRLMNYFVGTLLVGYGGVRLIKLLK